MNKQQPGSSNNNIYSHKTVIYLKIAIKSKERNNNNCIQQQFEYINNCI